MLRTRLGRLDVMQEVPGIEGPKHLGDSAVLETRGRRGHFHFAGLDDLIAMKAAVGRPQDEIDITSLERARGAHDA